MIQCVDELENSVGHNRSGGMGNVNANGDGKACYLYRLDCTGATPEQTLYTNSKLHLREMIT